MQDVEQVVEKICGLCGHTTSGAIDFCPEDGTLLKQSAKTSLLGQTLSGRYKVLSIIGSGGMGAVYKAQHLLLDRPVAVKVLHTYSGSDESERIKRFHQEGQVISALRHPNIVSALDFNAEDGMAYLVMDFIEGMSLQEFIATEGPMEWRRATRIMKQICDAIAYAHSMGIIHRDIKPSNILISTAYDGTETTKLLDFGVAKILHPGDEKSSPHTRTGIVFGSPLYMSPEQCLGQPPDARSDIYSLGCVMYELLSGHTAINGANSLEILHKQLSDVPPHFGALEKHLNIPFSIESVVFRALAKDEKERYQSMEDLIVDLCEAEHNPKFSATKKNQEAPPEPNWRRKLAATALFILTACTIFIAVRAHRLDVRRATTSEAHGHIQPVVNRVDGLDRFKLMAKAALLSQKAQMLLRMNKFEQAEAMFTEAVTIRKSLAAPDGELAKDLTKLSLAHQKQGELAEAHQCATEAMLVHHNQKTKTLAMADSLNCLGITMLEDKRYSDAEKSFLEAKELREKLGDKTSSNFADTLLGLSIAYKNQNRFEESSVILKQATTVRAASSTSQVSELFSQAEIQQH